MISALVTVPGGRFHVVDEGRRDHPPIVLLHAGIADLRAWDEKVPSLVDAGYRVVRYDARGFGTSTTEDVVPNVAHMIGMEVPDELAALIVGFLAPLPRWS